MFIQLYYVQFSIDTPGVIERVSHLFNAHPDLIQGFNTFLPPGYLIETGADGAIVVRTPSGTNQIAPAQTARQPPAYQPNVPSSHMLSFASQPAPYHAAHMDPGISSSAAPPIHPPRTVASPTPAPAFPSPSTSMPMSHDFVMQHSRTAVESNGNGQAQTLEFQRAISYVNKVKTRYQGEPEVYKQFLEILQRFQSGPPDKGDVTVSDPLSYKGLLLTRQSRLIAKLLYCSKTLPIW